MVSCSGFISNSNPLDPSTPNLTLKSLDSLLHEAYIKVNPYGQLICDVVTIIFQGPSGTFMKFMNCQSTLLSTLFCPTKCRQSLNAGETSIPALFEIVLFGRASVVLKT